MLVKEIFLPTRDIECDYFNSGEHTTDMPLGNGSMCPFGVFSRIGIERLSFGKITLFCGGTNQPINYLMRIVASVLGAESLTAEDNKLRVSAYAKCCIVKKNPKEEVNCVYISKRQIYEEIEAMRRKSEYYTSKSMSELYNAKINSKSVYVLEMPESGMSAQETAEVASLIYDTATQTGAQFIISTNSPIFMGIDRAVIYDLDRRPIVPQAYHRSSARKKFADIYDEICASHSKKY